MPSPPKGFWPLAAEIALVQGFDLPPDRLGLGFNWGRSAIEGRGPALALEHVRAMAGTGLLRSVVFSGATGEDSPWSPPWADTHIPPRGDDPALAVSAPSLLGLAEMTEALRAAGEVPHVGLKVAVRPEDADVPTRLAVAARPSRWSRRPGPRRGRCPRREGAAGERESARGGRRRAARRWSVDRRGTGCTWNHQPGS